MGSFLKATLKSYFTFCVFFVDSYYYALFFKISIFSSYFISFILFIKTTNIKIHAIAGFILGGVTQVQNFVSDCCLFVRNKRTCTAPLCSR